jgi:hypothetical protein
MVTDVTAPPEEEGQDPNELYKDERPEANLQQVIDEHINDSTMPRYTVVLENHPGGSIFLPKDVRLFLRNCGPVVLRGNGGNNAISYLDGESLVIIDCQDADITVNKTKGMNDFLGMDSCRIKMRDVQTKHTNCSNSTIEAVNHASGKSAQTNVNASYDKASFEKLLLDNSVVDARELSCHVELSAKNKSTVTASKVDVEKLVGDDSTLTLRDLKVKTTSEVKESNLTILDSLRGIQELQVEKSGYVCNSVKILADCRLIESSGNLETFRVEGKLEATKGQLTSSGLDIVGTTDFTEMKHIGFSDKHTDKVTYDKSVTNLADSEYLDDLYATDTTTHQRGLTVTGDIRYERGTTDMKSVTGQKNAFILEQAGRNYVRKVNFNDNLVVSGDGAAHLELTDSGASSVSAGVFAFGKINTVGGANMGLNDFGILELNKMEGNPTVTDSKVVSLTAIVGNVTVQGGVLNAKAITGNLTLTGCRFDVDGVSGLVTANDCVGSAKNAGGFIGNDTAASVKDVGGWDGAAFLISGMGADGPKIKGVPTLKIESPGTLHIRSDTQVIIQGPMRTETF